MLLEQDNLDLISADELARALCSPGKEAYTLIVERFGAEILNDQAMIDRRKLGQLVFSNREHLIELEEMIHPLVLRDIEDEISRLKMDYIVIEIPLLFEANFQDCVDVIVVVACTEDLQIERSQKRDGISEDEVRQRMIRQMPLREKVAQADFVIDNNQGEDETRRQVESLWPKIKTPK
jgi:dephospho-CoA kinase